MRFKFLILIAILVPILVNALSQEQWNAYAISQTEAEQLEQEYQFMQNLENKRKQNELKAIEQNKLNCNRNKMSQLEEFKITSTCSNTNNKDFEKRYLKCTLTQEDCNDISLRIAKTKNKFDKDIILSETEIIFYSNPKGYAPSTYKFKCSGNNVDIYSNYFDPIVFLNTKNKFILYNPYYSIKDKESLLIYQCREATFYEMMKMKIDE